MKTTKTTLFPVNLFPVTLLLVTLALGTSVSACGGHTEFHQAMLRTAPPSSQPALVYVEGQMPPGDYYELGLVQAIGFGSEANPEELVRTLTKEGAALGCQAIVRVGIDTGYMRGHASGVCVRFVGDPPSAAPVLSEGSAIRVRDKIRPPRPVSQPSLEPSPSALTPQTTN